MIGGGDIGKAIAYAIYKVQQHIDMVDHPPIERGIVIEHVAPNPVEKIDIPIKSIPIHNHKLSEPVVIIKNKTDQPWKKEMEKITKEEFIAALKIVNDYRQQLENELAEVNMLCIRNSVFQKIK